MEKTKFGLHACSPEPFYEQFFNVLFIDDSNNFLGSLAGDLRLSRLSETEAHMISVLSFLGRKDSRFNIDNLNISVYYTGPVNWGANMPPPPAEKEGVRILTLKSAECMHACTRSGILSDWLYFRLELVSSWGSTTYDAVVLSSSDGKVWKSERTLYLHILGIGSPVSELEGKTEAVTFVAIVH